MTYYYTVYYKFTPPTNFRGGGRKFILSGTQSHMPSNYSEQLMNQKLKTDDAACVCDAHLSI